MRKWLLLPLALAAVFSINYVQRAWSDYAATAGSGLTVFAFTCFTTKICPVATLANSAGTEIGTTANPLQASISQGSNTAVVATAGVDGGANTDDGLTTYSRMSVYNGASWDRLTGSITGGVNVTVVGAPGGCTHAKLITTASTNATVIKASAGTLYDLVALNTDSTTAGYVKLYDKASAPTCNSDTVLRTYGVGPSPLPSGVGAPLGPYGLAFTTGSAFCVVAGLADNNNGNAPATIIVNYSYK